MRVVFSKVLCSDELKDVIKDWLSTLDERLEDTFQMEGNMEDVNSGLCLDILYCI